MSIFVLIELATLPVDQRTQAGLFFYKNLRKEDYPKGIISIDKQIKLLKDRGLIINDEDFAKQILKNVSYFRLQGFWWEYQIDKKNHKFKINTTFEEVSSLYTFDRKLRLLLFDAIERVEVALRTKLVYYPSLEMNDWWWYENRANFFREDFYLESLADIDKELGRTKEVFIDSHYKNYGSASRPPAYKTFELLSFGCLSKIYSNFRNELECKVRIATEFDLPNYNFLKSWLVAFIVIRNISAHHSRLWNRNIHLPPKILSKPQNKFISIPPDPRLLYYSISCLLYVLNKVSPGHSLKEKIIDLLLENNVVDIEEMGFPKDWLEQPLWS